MAVNGSVSRNTVPNNHDGNFGIELNGTFPNMTNMNMAELNPMMQFLQNGMPNNVMGQFPNMMGKHPPQSVVRTSWLTDRFPTGLPGVGMDPMGMSQGMFGGFGGPGMGMNGMNMGMGFDAGQNTYGGFHEQSQAFNQSQYNGHANGMGGSFVADSGYGGNNMPQHQGNFNQMHQHQNFNNDFHQGYHNQGFYNRGRGRGRGAFFNAGRGRGHVGSAYQGREGLNEQTFQNPLPEQTKRRGSPVYAPMQGSEVQQHPEQVVDTESSGKVDEEQLKRRDEDQINKELEPGGAEDGAEESNPLSEDRAEMDKERANSEKLPSEQQPEAGSVSTEDNKPRPIQSILSDENVGANVSNDINNGPADTTMPPPIVQAIPTGPSKSTSGPSIPATSPRGRGFGRGFARGFADFRSIPRGRGSVPPADNSVHSHSSSLVETPFQVPSVSKGLGVEGAPTGPKALRQVAPNVGLKPSQDAEFSIMGRANAQAYPNGSMKSPRYSLQTRHSFRDAAF